MRTIEQLALRFPRSQGYTQAAFRPAPCNKAARAWLGRVPDWPGGRLALWGEAGSGKTHLLHIWAERTGAVLWDGPSLRGLPELPGSGGIAVDDADATLDETALLHLLNAAGEAGLPVLLAGRSPPARWGTRLADLATRLRAITAVEIGAPDDRHLRVLLARLFAERQVEVQPAVLDWLLLRLPRTPETLREAVARLDDAALARGSAITRALAADVLADLIGPRENEISMSAEAPSSEDPPVL